LFTLILRFILCLAGLLGGVHGLVLAAIRGVLYRVQTIMAV